MARFIPDNKMTFLGTNRLECLNHMVIDDDSRRLHAQSRTHDRCDNGLAQRWYRFIKGRRLGEQCAPTHHCNAYYPGWLVGGHPSVSAGRVTKKVCFDRKWITASCCTYHTYIMVSNCGSFYVYKLKPPPECNLRYCTTD